MTFNAAEMRRVRSGRTALMDEKPIKPRRLGHVVLFSTDPGKKVAFYNDVFQLRLSDTVASFLRALALTAYRQARSALWQRRASRTSAKCWRPTKRKPHCVAT